MISSCNYRPCHVPYREPLQVSLFKVEFFDETPQRILLDNSSALIMRIYAWPRRGISVNPKDVIQIYRSGKSVGVFDAEAVVFLTRKPHDSTPEKPEAGFPLRDAILVETCDTLSVVAMTGMVVALEIHERKFQK